MVDINIIKFQFALFGLEIDAKYVPLIGCSFLSSVLFESTNGYQLVRDPIKALVKLPWCLDKRQLYHKRVKAYLHSKLCSFQYEY